MICVSYVLQKQCTELPCFQPDAHMSFLYTTGIVAMRTPGTWPHRGWKVSLPACCCCHSDERHTEKCMCVCVSVCMQDIEVQRTENICACARTSVHLYEHVYACVRLPLHLGDLREMHSDRGSLCARVRVWEAACSPWVIIWHRILVISFGIS